MSNRQQFKVVLLGEGKVGKTSIILRYVRGQFSEGYQETEQAGFQTKRLNVEGRSVSIAIWDTAGQEKYHALAPIYYRGSDGAILVYDITDDDSFKRVRNWIRELREELRKDIPLCIVGNKTDLEKNRNVSLEDAEQLSKSVKAKHFQTSAKLNKGIEELFLDVTRRMLKDSPREAQPNANQATSTDNRRQQYQKEHSRKSLIVTEDVPDQPSGGCCG